MATHPIASEKAILNPQTFRGIESKIKEWINNYLDGKIEK